MMCAPNLSSVVNSVVVDSLAIQWAKADMELAYFS